METETRVLTMAELVDVFNRAISQEENYIGVRIETQGSARPEIIINPTENFETKLEYYQKAYNDDLTLKSFNGIKITGFMYGENFAEIQDWLVY